MLTKQILERGAEIKQKIKELEAEYDEISKDIVIGLVESQADKAEISSGSFILEKRKTWKYSDKVVNLEDQIKDMKKEEMADGTATYDEKQFLKFMFKR